MARLWMLTVNDRRLVRRVLEASGLPLDWLTAPSDGVCGAGLFASEVLTLKTPVAAGTRVDLLVGDKVRSQRVIGVLDVGRVAGFHPEAVQPFRHKGWVGAFATEEPLPRVAPAPEDEEFVSRYLQGRAPAELAFQQIMVHLMKGYTPGEILPEPTSLLRALNPVMRRLQAAGSGPISAAISMEAMGVVASIDRPLFFRTFTRIPHPLGQSRGLRASVVADGLAECPAGWTPVRAGSAVVLGPDARVAVIPAD